MVPSSLASTSLTTLTATQESFAGTVSTITLSSGTLTGFTPYAVYYVQVGGDGNQHIYTANISNSSVAPTPHQVSTLSVPVTTNTFDNQCMYQGYRVLTDPTTAYLIVEVPTATKACGTGTPGNQWVLVHLTDSASTATTAVPSTISTTNISSSYNSTGTLTGLILVDNTSKLAFYPASGTGTIVTGTETVIASSVSWDGSLELLSDRAAHALAGGSVTYVDVTNASSQSVLYRVNDAGAGSVVYTTTGGINGFGNIDSSPHDNTNIYFTDVATTGGAATSVKFLKAPIGGGAASTLYTDAAPASSPSEYQLVDSNGSLLIFTKDLPGTSDSIMTLSVAGGTPTTLVSTTTGVYTAFLDFPSDHLFVTTLSIGTAAPAGAVFTPNSTTPIAGQGGPGTYYAGFDSLFSFGSATASKVIEYTNMPVTYPSDMGGASLFTVDAGTFASVQVKQSGTNYVLPHAEVFFFPTSLTVGAGVAIDATTNVASGLVLDVSKAQLITIVAPNTDVYPDD